MPDIDTEKRTWAEVLDLLEHKYTLSIRDVCRLLKASRPWVNRYIKPHVETIYLNSNRRADEAMGVNWVKMAGRLIGREDMTESTWIHTEQFYDLLRRSVVSVTKQTKSVPIVYLMDNDKRTEYVAKRDELRGQYAAENNPQARKKIQAALIGLPYKYLDKDSWALAVTHCSVTERGKVERIDVEYPGDIDPSKWTAAHDVKDYGDSDEDVYRRFFRRGSIRVEICVADANGEPGSKVYYVDDPDAIADQWDDRVLNIPHSEWVKYANKRGL